MYAPATLSIVSPRTNIKNSSKSLIFILFFLFGFVAKQVGVGPPEKDRGFPPVGGEPLPVWGGATMLRPAPLCLGDRNPESGGWSLFRFGQFFGRNGTDRKGAQEGDSLPWQKNPPTAESKESDGEQREGDVCQGNGLDRVRSASSAESRAECGCKSRDQMRMPQGRAERGLGAYETSQ